MDERSHSLQIMWQVQVKFQVFKHSQGDDVSYPKASAMFGFSSSFLRREGSETEEPDEQGRKEGRKERGKEGRKEGMEERNEGRHGRRWSGTRGNSLEIAWGISAGGSETEAPDACGWTVKRGNSWGGARQRGSDAKMQSWWHWFFGQFPTMRLS